MNMRWSLENSLEYRKYINSYLTREDFSAKTNMISAYQLKEIIEKRLEFIYILNYDYRFAKGLNKDMNEKLKQRKYEVVSSKSKVLSKVKSEKIRLSLYKQFYKKRDINNSEEYSYEKFKFENNRMVITINYSAVVNGELQDEKKILIVKDYSSDKIYFGSEFIDERLLEENIEIFTEMFNIGEDFIKLTDEKAFGDEEILEVYNASDEEFYAMFWINSSGRAKVKANIVDKNNLNRLGKFNFLTLEHIDDIIEKEQDQILKKIPVNVSELTGIIGKIVEEHICESVIKLEKKKEE